MLTQTIVEKCICAKEVAAILGIGESTARALMREGVIESFRVGPKLLRTTPTRVGQYQRRALDYYRREVLPKQREVA